MTDSTDIALRFTAESAEAEAGAAAVDTALKGVEATAKEVGDVGKTVGTDIAAGADKAAPALAAVDTAAAGAAAELGKVGDAGKVVGTDVAAGIAKVEPALAGVENAAKDAGTALGAVGDKGAAAGTEIATGIAKADPALSEVEAAAKELEVALDRLDKAKTARAALQGAAAVKVALDELDAAAEAAGTSVDKLGINVKAAEEKMATGANKARAHADAVGDMTTRGNLAAQGMEAMAGKTSSLEGMLSVMKDTGGKTAAVFANIGFGAIAISGGFLAAVGAGKQLAEWIDKGSEAYGKFQEKQSALVVSGQVFGQALRHAESGLIGTAGASDAAKKALGEYAVAQLDLVKSGEDANANLGDEKLKLLDVARAYETLGVAGVSVTDVQEGVRLGVVKLTPEMSKLVEEDTRLAVAHGATSEEARNWIKAHTGMEVPAAQFSQIAKMGEDMGTALSGAYWKSTDAGNMLALSQEGLIASTIALLKAGGKDLPEGLTTAAARVAAMKAPFEDLGLATQALTLRTETLDERMTKAILNGASWGGVVRANAKEIEAQLPALLALGKGWDDMTKVQQQNYLQSIKTTAETASASAALGKYSAAALDWAAGADGIAKGVGPLLTGLGKLSEGTADYDAKLRAGAPTIKAAIDDLEMQRDKYGQLTEAGQKAAEALEPYRKKTEETTDKERERAAALSALSTNLLDVTAKQDGALFAMNKFMESLNRLTPGTKEYDLALKAAGPAMEKSIADYLAMGGTIDKLPQGYAAAAAASGMFSKSQHDVAASFADANDAARRNIDAFGSIADNAAKVSGGNAALGTSFERLKDQIDDTTKELDLHGATLKNVFNNISPEFAKAINEHAERLRLVRDAAALAAAGVDKYGISLSGTVAPTAAAGGQVGKFTGTAADMGKTIEKVTDATGKVTEVVVDSAKHVEQYGQVWQEVGPAMSASTTGFRTAVPAIQGVADTTEKLVQQLTYLSKTSKVMSTWIEPLISDFEAGKISIAEFTTKMEEMQQTAGFLSAFGMGTGVEYRLMLQQMALAEQEFFDASEVKRKADVKSAQEAAIATRTAWYDAHTTIAGITADTTEATGKWIYETNALADGAAALTKKWVELKDEMNPKTPVDPKKALGEWVTWVVNVGNGITETHKAWKAFREDIEKPLKAGSVTGGSGSSGGGMSGGGGGSGSGGGSLGSGLAGVPRP